VTVGASLTRPPRGNLYVGIRVLQGPFTAHFFLRLQLSDESQVDIVHGLSLDLVDVKNFGPASPSRGSASRCCQRRIRLRSGVEDSRDHFVVERVSFQGTAGICRRAHVPPAGANGLE